MKAAVISFDSAKFDVEAEPENDINPIRGHSCLAWLRPRLEAAGYRVDGPHTEDWGWYLLVQDAAARYLLGAIAWPGRNGRADWRLQLWRRRSPGQWLLRRGRITLRDPLVVTTLELVRSGGEAGELELELE